MFSSRRRFRNALIVMILVPMSIRMEDVFYDGVDVIVMEAMIDQDGDGFDGSADGGGPTEECPNATDCNDEDPEVRPVAGATEVQFNGKMTIAM